MSLNTDIDKKDNKYSTPYPTRKQPKGNSAGVKLGLGGALAAGALAAAKMSTNSTRLNPHFGHVGSVMGIGESTFFQHLRTIGSVGDKKNDKIILESEPGTIPNTPTEAIERVHRLRDFGANHNEFMLTLKAFGRKLPDTENLGDTKVEERFKVSEPIYKTILNIIEKDFSKQEK